LLRGVEGRNLPSGAGGSSVGEQEHILSRATESSPTSSQDVKLNAATSDFSVINYEEAKFVITLKDGRKYTVTIAPVGE
jgi:hypothetical protein